MTTILKFKTKPKTACIASDNEQGWRVVRDNAIVLPKTWARSHIVKAGRRVNPYTNSDMLGAIIKRALPEWAKRHDGGFALDNLPAGVTVTGGFIKEVTIELADA
jgi:hypothetical protein